MLAPWGSQLLSEGRNPGQGALGVSEAGAQVLLAALLGGGFSEQKGEEEEQPRCRTEGKYGLPNPLIGCGDPGYHQGRGQDECHHARPFYVLQGRLLSTYLH